MALRNSVANPFSRTTRSLQADGHRSTLLGLLTVILLLIVWGGWFFAARIPIYQTSENVQLTGAQRVTALFPSGTLDRIKRGQAANFYPEGAVWAQAGPIPAIVTGVSPDPTADQARVELALRLDRSLPVPLQQGLKGRVEIELERVSPASLVFRSGGLVNPSTIQNRSSPAN
jgi:hypothetical protein